MANITSVAERLTAADISATSAVVELLTSEAIDNPKVEFLVMIMLLLLLVLLLLLLLLLLILVQVRDDYLEIIDHIQQAAPEPVFVSQVATRSSQR